VIATLTAALGDALDMAWLMPDVDQRRETTAVYLGIHTRYALAHRLVNVVANVPAALWVPHTGPFVVQEAYAEASPDVGAQTLAWLAAL
jgi:hypothetical protein